MSAVDVIDRYLSDVRSIREARERGQLDPIQAERWIERLDDALFDNVNVGTIALVEQEVEGYVLLGSRDAEPPHPGNSLRV
jgi:hypothetical protein